MPCVQVVTHHMPHKPWVHLVVPLSFSAVAVGCLRTDPCSSTCAYTSHAMSHVAHATPRRTRHVRIYAARHATSHARVCHTSPHAQMPRVTCWMDPRSSPRASHSGDDDEDVFLASSCFDSLGENGREEGLSWVWLSGSPGDFG